MLMYRFSHAALAFEQCDKSFKAVFAEPRNPNKRSSMNDGQESNIFDTYVKNSNTSSFNLPLPETRSEGYNKLIVVANPSVNQDQLWKLFDIVPSKL